MALTSAGNILLQVLGHSSGTSSHRTHAPVGGQGLPCPREGAAVRQAAVRQAPWQMRPRASRQPRRRAQRSGGPYPVPTWRRPAGVCIAYARRSFGSFLGQSAVEECGNPCMILLVYICWAHGRLKTYVGNAIDHASSVPAWLASKACARRGRPAPGLFKHAAADAADRVALFRRGCVVLHASSGSIVTCVHLNVCTSWDTSWPCQAPENPACSVQVAV